MSIMIKGIDMPINCTRCPCSNDESRFCRAANEYIPMLGKPDFCPLEEAEERKKGKWIVFDIDEEKYDEIKCTFCKHTFIVDSHHWTDIGFTKDDLNFCPHCGADMRGEGNGNE